MEGCFIHTVHPAVRHESACVCMTQHILHAVASTRHQHSPRHHRSSSLLYGGDTLPLFYAMNQAYDTCEHASCA
jgi:hypothetical protein